ncbi:hypothetical protein GCM10023168_37430 [Fodinibacter luteus]|uniref:Uncharacterized protein n=1 Tax=Fodinibacter luteus TaxID=552064 RepID=A0ABP8KT66_9MICO
MGLRQRFRGRIAGVGSTSGVRVVVGWWHESPFGAFADAMVERADGHRILLAPSEQVRDLVAATYVFDETRIEPFGVAAGGSAGSRWVVTSPSLSMWLDVGDRMPLGRLLRLLPRPLAQSPAFATVADPVARVALRGVRTRGVARAGRREFYGATDVHAVTALGGRLDGLPLGDLRPVDPPCRFGFSSTPRAPSVTDVVTTILDT